MTLNDWCGKHPYYGWIIASVIVSIGAAIIHARGYNPDEWGLFFSWLPIAWVMTFIPVLYFQIDSWIFKNGEKS